MVFKRYIYRNGKKFGPYYYHNKKVNGKVISNYIGTKDPKNKNRIKIAIIILSIISIILLIYLASVFELFSTGRQIESLNKKEGITGTVPGQELTKEDISKVVDKLQEVQEPPVVNTIQGSAVINQPVSWTKQITLQKPGAVKISIPKEAENIVAFKFVGEPPTKEKIPEKNLKITAKASADIVFYDSQIKKESPIITFFKRIIGLFTGKVVTIEEGNESKEVIIEENSNAYEIVYETPGPYTIETPTDKGKIIKLVSPGGINYNDVLVSTNIEKLNSNEQDLIRIYWIEKQEYIDYNTIDDSNSDGIYDSLEFVAPESNNQTFEIIVITKAEHLDENRTFISDVYEKVKELDDIWSEEIQSGDYVRVTFEKNLSSENDITIYPRIVKGNPKIMVYEENENNEIAEFTNLTPNEYNTIYLTNLQTEQDTFDLRVLGGSLELDYIVDPIANPSPPTGGTILRSQTCLMESSSAIQFNYITNCQGVYPSACGATTDRIGCNDGAYVEQTITTTNNRYSGMFTSVFNSSINNCIGINQVFLCYEWWRSGSGTVSNCVVQVDANGGTSYTNISTACPGTIANPNVICTNVTASEVWNCGNFFGSSGTMALTRSQIYKTAGNVQRFLRTDVFYFNVTYTADTTDPAISNANTNATTINQNEYFCLNATATDISGVSKVFAQVWNTTTTSNYTMTDTGTNCGGTTGDGVYGVEVQGTAIGLWNYSKVYANDSFNNWNSLDFADLLINVTNTPVSHPPGISSVGPVPSVGPIEGSIQSVAFDIVVTDTAPNGYLDITSVNANFTKDVVTRIGICSHPKEIDPRTASYNCSVDMFYYDEPGDWNVNVSATDSQGDTATDNSQRFTYLPLKAFVIVPPTSLNWPTLNTGMINISSSNPSVLNNTGNYEGTISITAKNLTGEINPGERIPAISFRAGPISGSECFATRLQDSISTIITGSNLVKGSGTTNIYYCINSVPYVSTQPYSAKGTNGWIISI